MDQRLAAAQAALQNGQKAEAIEHLTALLSEAPDQPASVYFTLAVQLYHGNRFAEAEVWAAKALQRHPRNLDLWNIRGVLLRRLGRFGEALEALQAALRLKPSNVSALTNLANVYLDSDDAKAAEATLTRLIRIEPKNAEHHRLLARALHRQGRIDASIARVRQALLLNPKNLEAWLDLIGRSIEFNRFEDASQALAKANTLFPGNPRLAEGQVRLLRQQGRMSEAAAFLEQVLAADERQAWAHFQLAYHSAETDEERIRALQHLRRAVELEPANLEYLFNLIEALNRARHGDEAANIEEAYQLLSAVPELRGVGLRQMKVANDLLIRVADYQRLEELPPASTLARSFADAGLHAALLSMLGRVRTLQDRHDLLEAHRTWGVRAEQRAVASGLPARAPRGPRTKLRLGLMSSDLRQHPVGYFAQPLFDHFDRERFELHVYSYYTGAADGMQRYMAERSTAYNQWPAISDKEAADRIAADGLDMLIELGGSTHMNRLEVMAFKPAARQASWLGYPHSAGLGTIDNLICDPYCAPPRRELLIEAPLMMPQTWIALGRIIFSDRNAIEEGLPEERAGVITFGTANNPHKYNPDLFDLWARVLQAVPGSRFAFVRPEGGSPSFRAHVLAEFARGGVSADRIDFHVVRGAHMPFYNRIDISLDTAPLTGGTTTTESLWMGVPVVSLLGEAFFERLSYSILTNTGLGDLCTDDRDRYVDIAAALAADRPRRRDLRQGLREMMRNSPLGRTEAFAHDFYDMLARELGGPAS